MEAICGQKVVKRYGLRSGEKRAIRNYLHAVLLEPRMNTASALYYLVGIDPPVRDYTIYTLARNLRKDIPQEIAVGRHKKLDSLAFHGTARPKFISLVLHRLADRSEIFDYLAEKIERFHGISYFRVLSHAITSLNIIDFFKWSAWEAMFYTSGRIEREILSFDMIVNLNPIPDIR